ncbi:DUF4189 domain-containing protein [Mycobacterium vicinigordonae]|uniref:DUF4189 domain-containing protein n=1 Tax=Mycobacterium vicinigordonae TaxID=1719132 RepID=A0A7D6E4R3_9MYCO|nr:DUF4189 domain-containing protein [Mycobacterium vicinigordonae]
MGGPLMAQASTAAALVVGAAIMVVTPAGAGADPNYVSVAVGYQPSGAPQGMPYVSATAAGARQGAMQSCQAHLSACAPAGTSTQCIGIATGFGSKWMEAEGPDRKTAEANARAKLLDLMAGLPLPDPTTLDPDTTGACAFD